MESEYFRKTVIAPYFLEREMPYTKRRPLKMKSLYWTAGVGILLFIVLVMFFGGAKEKKFQPSSIPDYPAHSNRSTPGEIVGAGSIQAGPNNAFHSDFRSPLGGIGYSGIRTAPAPRNRSANQVIRRGEAGNDPAARLPMGYGIPVKLINSVLSTDSATPVIAEVTEDVLPPGASSNAISIATGTRAMGTASYDDASRRIQIRFNTLVYPEGDQHGFQGIGLMPDGSAGLSGDYHSGEVTRRLGGFLGNFVGGLADGMKERTTGGRAGIPYEPGSIKNGVLNGISLSASDGTKSMSDDLRQTKPTMTLPAGQVFIIYLEHQYIP